jgi:cell division protein FtsN
MRFLAAAVLVVVLGGIHSGTAAAGPYNNALDREVNPPTPPVPPEKSRKVYYLKSRSCGYCTQTTPIVQRLAEREPDKYEVLDWHEDADKAREIFDPLPRGVPAWALRVQDQTIATSMGVKSEAQIRAFYESASEWIFDVHGNPLYPVE